MEEYRLQNNYHFAREWIQRVHQKNTAGHSRWLLMFGPPTLSPTSELQKSYLTLLCYLPPPSFVGHKPLCLQTFAERRLLFQSKTCRLAHHAYAPGSLSVVVVSVTERMLIFLSILSFSSPLPPPPLFVPHLCTSPSLLPPLSISFSLVEFDPTFWNLGLHNCLASVNPLNSSPFGFWKAAFSALFIVCRTNEQLNYEEFN